MEDGSDHEHEHDHDGSSDTDIDIDTHTINHINNYDRIHDTIGTTNDDTTSDGVIHGHHHPKRYDGSMVNGDASRTLANYPVETSPATSSATPTGSPSSSAHRQTRTWLQWATSNDHDDAIIGDTDDDHHTIGRGLTWLQWITRKVN